MVYISGANKNRLGKRRFDALFEIVGERHRLCL
jgi:hypothetical protein